MTRLAIAGIAQLGEQQSEVLEESRGVIVASTRDEHVPEQIRPFVRDGRVQSLRARIPGRCCQRVHGTPTWLSAMLTGTVLLSCDVHRANTVIVADGHPGTSGGTSASAPIFAAIITAVNDARIAAGKSPVGWINPAVRTVLPSALSTIDLRADSAADMTFVAVLEHVRKHLQRRHGRKSLAAVRKGSRRRLDGILLRAWGP